MVCAVAGVPPGGANSLVAVVAQGAFCCRPQTRSVGTQIMCTYIRHPAHNGQFKYIEPQRRDGAWPEDLAVFLVHTQAA